MNNTPQSGVRCSNCGTPLNIPVRSIVDAHAEPQMKMMLLNGELNSGTCTACGTPNTVLTPILYHDGEKELLVAFVPAEVAMQTGRNEEQIVGEMMNMLSENLPKDQFKAYMFNPKRTLTMQGLVNLILEADGITPEMIDAQKQQIGLVQGMIEAEPDALDDIIRQNDDKIDQQFFQVFSALAQRLLQNGSQELADRLVTVQERLIELTTFGQQIQAEQEAQAVIIEEVAEELQSIAGNATRADLINMVAKYVGQDEHLDAIVGMARPAFDYEFFQELTVYIGQAPSEEREGLENMRDRLVEATQAVDQQMQSAAKQAAGLLQEMLNATEIDQVIATNLPAIDDVFMQVLTMNLQEAQRRNDNDALNRLQQIYDRVMTILQAQMQPELRFVNELMSADSEATMQQMIAEGAGEYGMELLEVIDAVARVLQSQGNQQALNRLALIQQQVSEALAE